MAIRVQQFPSKRSEFTYGIQKAALAQIVDDNVVTLLHNPEQAVDVWRHLDENVIGARRSYIDKTEVLRQFIAYTLLFRRNGEFGHIEFGVYLRNKKNGEVKLASALSLGAGGHTERKDVHEYVDPQNLPVGSKGDGDTYSDSLYGNGEVDVKATVFANYQREFFEEVVVESSYAMSDRLLGFVSDSGAEGYIGNTHVGLIHAVEVLNMGDFEMAEEMNDRIGWFTPSQLLDMLHGVAAPTDPALPAFEPWSKLIIQKISAIAALLMGAERLVVSDEAFDKITEMVEGDVQPNEALVKLMGRPKPWAATEQPRYADVLRDPKTGELKQPVIDPNYHGQS